MSHHSASWALYGSLYGSSCEHDPKLKVRSLISDDKSVDDAEPLQQHPRFYISYGFLCTVWIAMWIILKRDLKLKVRDLISDNKTIDNAEPLQ